MSKELNAVNLVLDLSRNEKIKIVIVCSLIGLAIGTVELLQVVANELRLSGVRRMTLMFW